jgi:hypothetical protein
MPDLRRFGAREAACHSTHKTPKIFKIKLRRAHGCRHANTGCRALSALSGRVVA